MIFDLLQNHAAYVACNPRFAKAFAFLERAVRENLPVGRYELDGSALYAMIQEYDTNPAAQNKIEAHRRYIDIQLVVFGTEAMEVTDARMLTVQTPYDEAKDVLFFAETEPTVRAVLSDGAFGIFMPHDAHKPGLCATDTPSHVKKIVVKVAVASESADL